ncbi:MAG: hypothetical protein GOMPHAMPRED_000284 [Gomphillus americanus]|uniref:J domain-containing protein n=1 Tax=Gomphillus americanus TaxID=1940652 RepID=A0A8H3EE22_9LECA|nr:MAG: hypothetical protein GOMPHAMPRED_000284 [Gomphillus americanus]
MSTPSLTTKPSPFNLPPASQPKDPEKDSEAILNALERESKEWDKDSEIARILSTFSLDAYSVLDLQPGVPESSIIATYRKKSLLIHPDKTKNPSAPLAFDKLKKAQTELLDEKSRTRLDEAIADARTLLMRERGWNGDSEEMKPDSMSEEIRKAWREKTKVVLVENEMRRQKQLKVQMAEEGREQKRMEEEVTERKRKREAETAWENGREERISSWRTFAGGKKGPATGGASGSTDGAPKKKKKMKVLG